jgi:hypothetical protein
MAGGDIKQKGKSGKKGRFKASCRGICLRVAERRYPGARDWIEIERKWLYVFHEPSEGADPELADEIYAPARGTRKIYFWRALRKPGKLKSPYKHPNYRKKPPGWYQGDPKKRTGVYTFFLSPIQLGPDTLNKLKDRIKATAKNRESAMFMNFPGTTYVLDLHNNEEEPENVVNCHSFEKQPSGRICIILIPDPLSWAEDLQALGYQAALHLWRTQDRDEKRVSEVLVAQAFKGAMAGGDPQKIRRHLKRPHYWFDRTRSKRPTFSYKKNVAGRATNIVAAEVPVDKWDRVRVGAKTSADLRLNIHKLEMEALRKTVNREAKRLTDWLEGERHRIVEQGALELTDKRQKYKSARGDLAFQLMIVHWAKVTARLGEIEAGVQFQLRIYEKESKRSIRMLMDQAKPSSPGEWWEKQDLIQKVGLSTFKLVENFAGALSISEGRNFEPFMKRVLGMKIFGVKWNPPDHKKFPRIFGKKIPTSMKSPHIEIPAGTRLADAKELFDKYQIDSWFAGIGIGVSAINMALALNKIMEGKASTTDKLKAGFDGLALVADVAKLSLEIPAKRLEQLAKSGTLDDELLSGSLNKGKIAAISRVGYFAGACGSLIDWHVAVCEIGKEAFMNDNPEAVAGRVIQATGAAIGFGAAVFGLIFGGIVSGPVGWIALAAAGLSIFGSWLASHFSRTKWGDVALYSFLGERAGEGDVYKEYFWGRSNGFAKDYKAQVDAVTGLMSSLVFELPQGCLGRVKIKPGFIGDKTKFYLTWQFGYRGMKSNRPEFWVTIKSVLYAKQGRLKVLNVKKEGDSVRKDYKVGTEVYMEKVVVEDGRCTEFTLFPPIPDTYRKKVLPVDTTVLLQVDVSGDGHITVPIESSTEFEYTLPNGKTTKLGMYSGLHTGTVREEKTEVS